MFVRSSPRSKKTIIMCAIGACPTSFKCIFTCILHQLDPTRIRILSWRQIERSPLRWVILNVYSTDVHAYQASSGHTFSVHFSVRSSHPPWVGARPFVQYYCIRKLFKRCRMKSTAHAKYMSSLWGILALQYPSVASCSLKCLIRWGWCGLLLHYVYASENDWR